MKDLVEILWRSLTQYIPLLVALLSAPRATVLRGLYAGDLPAIK